MAFDSVAQSASRSFEAAGDSARRTVALPQDEQDAIASQILASLADENAKWQGKPWSNTSGARRCRWTICFDAVAGPLGSSGTSAIPYGESRPASEARGAGGASTARAGCSMETSLKACKSAKRSRSQYRRAFSSQTTTC